jgi:hypothetical protein
VLQSAERFLKRAEQLLAGTKRVAVSDA